MSGEMKFSITGVVTVSEGEVRDWLRENVDEDTNVDSIELTAQDYKNCADEYFDKVATDWDESCLTPINKK